MSNFFLIFNGRLIYYDSAFLWRKITDGKLSIDKKVDEALKYIKKEKIDEAFHDKITECVNEGKHAV